MSVEKHIDTAVIPVAGLGTRMAPFTEGIPKFMAPISEGDKSIPNIDYTLNDCVTAGIKNLVVITSDGGDDVLKRYLGPISNDRAERYKSLGKMEELEAEVARRAVFASMNIECINQPVGKYGTAIPLDDARPALRGVKYFAVTGGDDFLWHPLGTSELALAIEDFKELDTDHLIMGKAVDRPDYGKRSNYGILQLNSEGQLAYIDEKPLEEQVPPRPLANISRYILQSDMMWPHLDELLARPRPPKQPEYYVTDVINAAVAAGQTFGVHRAVGIYCDAGSPKGITKASNDINEEIARINNSGTNLPRSNRV